MLARVLLMASVLVPLVRAEDPLRWLERIKPTGAEQGWHSIGWLASLWDGVEEAHRARKPILLWAMNGHPLGCT